MVLTQVDLIMVLTQVDLIIVLTQVDLIIVLLDDRPDPKSSRPRSIL